MHLQLCVTSFVVYIVAILLDGWQCKPA